MPRIIVMNIGIEDAAGHGLISTQHLLTLKSCYRNAWFANERDIIVSSFEINKDFLQYIGQTIGFDSTSIELVTPCNSSFALTDDILLYSDLITKCKELISVQAGWTIFPCLLT